jgi:hypothetical protein
MSHFRKPYIRAPKPPGYFDAVHLLKRLLKQAESDYERKALVVAITTVEKHYPGLRRQLLDEFTIEELRAAIERRQTGQGGT